MTQEEKAKAYDEALNQAKFYHENCPSEPERKKLEKMFPVLCESGDERIRKALIRYFEWVKERDCKSEWNGLKVDDIRAWLEKQKEQPHSPSNLEEAAEEYADYNSQRWHEDGDVYYDHSKIMDAFKAGAEWSKKDEGQEPEYAQHFDPDC